MRNLYHYFHNKAKHYQSGSRPTLARVFMLIQKCLVVFFPNFANVRVIIGVSRFTWTRWLRRIARREGWPGDGCGRGRSVGMSWRWRRQPSSRGRRLGGTRAEARQRYNLVVNQIFLQMWSCNHRVNGVVIIKVPFHIFSFQIQLHINLYTIWILRFTKFSYVLTHVRYGFFALIYTIVYIIVKSNDTYSSSFLLSRDF